MFRGSLLHPMFSFFVNHPDAAVDVDRSFPAKSSSELTAGRRLDASSLRRNHAATHPRCDTSALRRNRAATQPPCDATALRRIRAATHPRCDSTALQRIHAATQPLCDANALRRIHAATHPRATAVKPRLLDPIKPSFVTVRCWTSGGKKEALFQHDSSDSPSSVPNSRLKRRGCVLVPTDARGWRTYK